MCYWDVNSAGCKQPKKNCWKTRKNLRISEFCKRINRIPALSRNRFRIGRLENENPLFFAEPGNFYFCKLLHLVWNNLQWWNQCCLFQFENCWGKSECPKWFLVDLGVYCDNRAYKWTCSVCPSSDKTFSVENKSEKSKNEFLKYHFWNYIESYHRSFHFGIHILFIFRLGWKGRSGQS